MPRTVLPLYASDISAFARSLSQQIAAKERTPTHLELLNMLARSAGYRNFQHFRVQMQAQGRVNSAELKPEIDFEKLKHLARYFDARGLLNQWPGKQSYREMCLWVLWSRLKAGQMLSEEQINRQLRASHIFGDPALLRRELYDMGLVSRTADCREYRRIERRPPDEARELIRVIESRRTA
jgi:hypothetical protein